MFHFIRFRTTLRVSESFKSFKRIACKIPLTLKYHNSLVSMQFLYYIKNNQQLLYSTTRLKQANRLKLITITKLTNLQSVY